MRKNLFASLVCFVAFVCANSAPAQTSEILKVGGVHSMSGPATVWGNHANEGIVALVEKINKAGGLKVGDKTYQLKYINYDSAGTVEGAATAGRRLIFEDGVKFILGVNRQVCGMAIQPISEPAKVIMFFACSGGKELAPPNKYSFNNIAIPDFGFMGWLNWSSKNLPGLKTVAHLAKDDPFGMASSGAHKRIVEGKIKIVYDGFYPPASKDFFPYLSAAIAKNPDYIDLDVIEPGPGALLIKQIREMGYKKPIVGHSSPLTKEITDVVGWDALQNVYMEGQPVQGTTSSTPLMEELYKWFLARNKGNEPIGIFYLWYDAALSLLKAMEVARTLDTDKIVEVMGSDTFTWEGPFGRNRFFGKAQIGQNRNPARRTVIMRVEGTKVKLVGEYAF